MGAQAAPATIGPINTAGEVTPPAECDGAVTAGLAPRLNLEFPSRPVDSDGTADRISAKIAPQTVGGMLRQVATSSRSAGRLLDELAARS